eukprot:792978_1
MFLFKPTYITFSRTAMEGVISSSSNLSCICNNDLTATLPTIYGVDQYQVVYCNHCLTELEWRDTLYHCTKGSTAQHPNGYDLCSFCHFQIRSNRKYGTPIFHNHQRDSSHSYLRLVSWNVNLETLSAYTPKEWTKHNNKWHHVYKQIASQNPDIISLQEIPLPYFGATSNRNVHPLIQKYIESNHWFITKSTRSHCGHTIMLIHKRVSNVYGYDVDCDNIDPLNKWPTVILRKKSKNILLFGVHLNYGDHGSIQRKMSFDRLYALAKKYNMHHQFVLIGDTNMREYDERDILQKYRKYGISSCWDLIEPEHLKRSSFMATFYRNFFEIGKQGTTRYDKLFLGKNLKCVALGIFDKTVSENIPFHFLSDHRGLVAEIEI